MIAWTHNEPQAEEEPTGSNDGAHNTRASAIASIDTAAERYVYSPYGKVSILRGDRPQAQSGFWDVATPILFAGYRYDQESSLYLARGRWYDSSLGRFTSPDPAGFQDGMSLYEYVQSNSINDLDPMGLYRVCGSVEVTELNGTLVAPVNSTTKNDNGEHKTHDNRIEGPRFGWSISKSTFGSLPVIEIGAKNRPRGALLHGSGRFAYTGKAQEPISPTGLRAGLGGGEAYEANIPSKKFFEKYGITLDKWYIEWDYKVEVSIDVRSENEAETKAYKGYDVSLELPIAGSKSMIKIRPGMSSKWDVYVTTSGFKMLAKAATKGITTTMAASQPSLQLTTLSERFKLGAIRCNSPDQRMIGELSQWHWNKKEWISQNFADIEMLRILKPGGEGVVTVNVLSSKSVETQPTTQS